MEEQKLHVWNVTEQLLSSRVVKIYGEINTQVAYDVTSLLDVLNNDNPSAPIKLEINTPGGSVLDGLAIVDKIKTISAPVIAFNTGVCASMGTVICAACDYAFGMPNCQFMIHEISSGTQGKFRDMKNSLAFDEALNRRTMSIVAAKCGKTFDDIMNDAIYDKWMSADEALEYHLIDKICNNSEKDQKVLKTFLKSYK